jgi:methylenetetrahydrofolate reductase (NADPH)
MLFLLQEGIEPNYQMVCRDRNRLAMQSDILGAYAHGIKNMLCLSGDHPNSVIIPNAKGVFDIDSMQLINLVKFMRDEKKFLSGDGTRRAAQHVYRRSQPIPLRSPLNGECTAWPRKSRRALTFIQTQCIYNMERFREFMKKAVDMGLHEKCYILAGVTPMKSVGMAQYMAKSVPGMDVPESVINRLRGAGKGKVAEEGIKIRHRADRGVQTDEGGCRSPSHGNRMGAHGAGDCRKGRRSPTAGGLLTAVAGSGEKNPETQTRPESRFTIQGAKL